jgi:TatD-related deoxyribonuclease
MTDAYDGPILDDHLHLDPEHGRGIDAVEDFARAGGTHMLVVNKPSWMIAEIPEDEAIFQSVFETTIEAVEQATEVLPGRAWPILGVHPALISKLTGRGYTPDQARDIMQAGLDIAAEYVADGPALGLKSGRPHYDVGDPVRDASNDVMRYAFELGAETGCAVQLHTEGGQDFTQVVDWAQARGLPAKQVVKHYAEGRLDGPTKSVLADKDELEIAAEMAEPFLMETDFIDDPDRPGAVLGPKTVPRRTEWLLENGHEDAVRTAHIETPASVYGIDTEATP